MGSKALLLQKGLGDLIKSESRWASRFVDLFTGAGHVSHFVARHTHLPVVAVDLQNYATTLAKAVIERIAPINQIRLESLWLEVAVRNARKSRSWTQLRALESEVSTSNLVEQSRQICAYVRSVGPITKAYGGYYFSPAQALIFDHMLAVLPKRPDLRNVCLATMICVASRCAAAPGHTAQPFQPTEKGGRYLREAWKRDPATLARQYLGYFATLFANRRGHAFTGDAVEFTQRLNSKDLVFIDPPYSDVQYSRFYHVLETIAVGRCGDVSGSGRYPPVEERPQSDFSKRGTSLSALENLLNGLGDTRAKAIFTFPAAMCSNGISSEAIEERAEGYFEIRRFMVNGVFSTLGGNNSHRKPTQSAEELVMMLKPKARRTQSQSKLTL